MPMTIQFDHPKQKLLFFVAQDFDEKLPSAVALFISQIGSQRPWLIEKPQFIDEIHASNFGTPVRTVGGVFQIYSAVHPWELPIETDEQHLDEVTWLIEALRKFSAENALAIEFELDGTFVGSVEDGRIDRTLSEGLLNEWRCGLERKKKINRRI